MTVNDRSGPPAALARWTGFLLAWVAATGGEHYGRALSGLGLKDQHLGVLVLLRDGPQVQARLSEQLGVFKPVMVGLVNDLEEMGLVVRRRHPTDRRAVQVHLLKAGEQRIREAERISARASEEFFGVLTPEERRTFHELLAKLAGLTDEEAQ
jgi:DNA-binding MarR family transcriptional regulator